MRVIEMLAIYARPVWRGMSAATIVNLALLAHSGLGVAAGYSVDPVISSMLVFALLVSTWSDRMQRGD